MLQRQSSTLLFSSLLLYLFITTPLPAFPSGGALRNAGLTHKDNIPAAASNDAASTDVVNYDDAFTCTCWFK